jgi:hypothetical protein
VRDDGGEVLNTTEYSDRLMEVMLKWRYPEQLASRVNVRVEEPLGLEPEVLILMAPADRRALLELLRKYAALAEPRRQALLEGSNG